MKSILIGLNALLLGAVIYLFVKVNSLDKSNPSKETTTETSNTKADTKSELKNTNASTGRIAFINIDSLNEQSLYLIDLMRDVKNRKSALEGSFQSMQTNYQTKMQELQESYKAGIATEAQMKAEAQKIRQMENDMANKQVQMDNLVDEAGKKNADFQNEVRAFLKEYTNGQYDYVLSYSTTIPSMLIGNEQLELTTEVIKQLNERYQQKKAEKSLKK
jgi:outer membrane protein